LKSGFVAIIGKPNAGKSTLMNVLIGEKVSIVSWRPQTTRNKITGILTSSAYQIVFLDTPGIHTPRTELGGYMMKAVSSAVNDVDVILFVADAVREIDSRDIELLKEYAGTYINVVVVINKVDEVLPEKVFSEIEKLKDIEGIHKIIPISALKGNNISLLRDELIKLMPDGAQYYPEDMITDRTVRFMTAEILREKALKFLAEEVPHGIGVDIRKFKEREDKPIIDIYADIICEKESHKAIIIGRSGETLKKISSIARQDIEKLLDSQVFLKTFVKIKEGWRDDGNTLRDLGYDKREI